MAVISLKPFDGFITLNWLDTEHLRWTIQIVGWTFLSSLQDCKWIQAMNFHINSDTQKIISMIIMVIIIIIIVNNIGLLCDTIVTLSLNQTHLVTQSVWRSSIPPRRQLATIKHKLAYTFQDTFRLLFGDWNCQSFTLIFFLQFIYLIHWIYGRPRIKESQRSIPINIFYTNT